MWYTYLDIWFDSIWIVISFDPFFGHAILSSVVTEENPFGDEVSEFK